MPASAFALVATFIVIAVVAGVVSWRVVGLRQLRAVGLPVFAAFVALYVVGHRLGLSVGPTVRLFGFEVALAFDIAVASAAAFAVAITERVAADRLRRRRGEVLRP